jgi:glycosyltransferase involved in cell wall biosynthesis
VKILIATVHIPFIEGGAETHAALLGEELAKRGHDVDILRFPVIDYTADGLINAMMACRGMGLEGAKIPSADLVIAMKFPAYYIKHPNKVIWLMHQHRRVYDLWDTEYSDRFLYPEAERIRDMIFEHDSRYIKEARAVFANSRNVSMRLKKYNGIDSAPLYSLPKNDSKFHAGPFEDFVFYPSRITKIKRQDLFVDAAKHLKGNIKLVISGSGSRQEEDDLRAKIRSEKLEDRVKYIGFISEEEKIDLYSRCLAVYFGPYDEDLGYVTMEAFLSKKPVITHVDSGGPLEFVEHGVSGFVTDVSPRDIAKAINDLSCDKALASRMGGSGYSGHASKKMDWDYVINTLTKA